MLACFAAASWAELLPEADLAALRFRLADPFACSPARGGLAAPDPGWKA